MAKKLSAIIPTLQKGEPEVLKRLLATLECDAAVGEVILIDNSGQGLADKYDKVKVIIPKKNLYVNPSWNLGIEMAQNDYFVLLNDDIYLPKDFCFKILDYMQNNCSGLIGLSKTSCHNVGCFSDISFDKPTADFSITKIQKRTFNYWGSAIFGKKEDYYKIDDELKIWYGDDYLIMKNKENGREIFQINNCNIYHVHSTTSNSQRFSKIIKADMKYYVRYDKTLEKEIRMRYSKRLKIKKVIKTLLKEYD